MDKKINLPEPAIRDRIIATGRQVVEIEQKAVAGLLEQLGDDFARAVDLILHCKGRVIITGVGKSGIIARKIAATLTSTGTVAIFLHPVDAMHGDLGLVLADDVVICISKSGNTDEISALIPVFKQLNVPIISIIGNRRSALADRSDIILDVFVAEEACPLDLAPTSSTTATLVMGDALAMALLEQRDFGAAQFAKLHPGGSLGRRLTLKISEIMFTGDKVPIVYEQQPLRDAINEITGKRFGCTCVLTVDGLLAGIITDGDLRRLLAETDSIGTFTAGDIMVKNPKTLPQDAFAITAFNLMEKHNITQVIIVDPVSKPVGIVHLHDLIEAGLR